MQQVKASESKAGTADNKDGNTTLLALVDLARRLGVETSVTELRRSYALPKGELQSDLVLAVAKGLGLEAKRLTITFDQLPKLERTLPALLRAKDGSAVVLESVRVDPIMGVVAMLGVPSEDATEIVPVEERHLAEVWSGEIILLKQQVVGGGHDEPTEFGISWLLAQVLRERKLFVDISAAAIVSTAFALAPPLLFMMVIDRVLVNQSMSTLNVIFGAILLLIAFEMALGYVRRVLTEVATTRIDGRLNLYLMDKLLKLPMNYFEQNPTGQITSKVGRMWQIRHFLTGQLFGAFLEAVPLLGLIPVMLILKWELALLCFSLTAIVAWIVYIFIKPIGRRYTKLIAAETARSSYLVETIYGMRTVKSLALEGRRKREWDVRVAKVTAAQHELGMFANYPQTFSLPFERLIYSGTFAVGAYMALSSPNAINPGALVAFAMLSMRLAAPLIKIAHLQQDFAEVRGAIAELASLLNSPPEVENENAGLRPRVLGEVSFSGVRFRYNKDSNYALDDISITIPKGATVGIMGRSGSGKTTITRLLQRLHSSYEGLIKIDGVDLREFNLAHLRSSIGVVPQENFLFSGTIRENIGMARPDASFAQIVRAAQLAGAEEFIERLPRGYETYLSEGASNLSGGQRQRLAIARALLVDPPILILDEATSALDAESETIVNANLKRIAQGRTVISVSHRLSMLVDADIIIVMERGKVYDIGTHDELLARCDIYKHLWYQQNRHAERSSSILSISKERAS